VKQLFDEMPDPVSIRAELFRGFQAMNLIARGLLIPAVLLAALAGMSGCVKTTTTTQAAPAGSAAAAVQVLYSPPTDRQYNELGLVTTQSGQTVFHDRSAQGMIAKLQEEAAKLGADAIIVRGMKEGSWGLKGGGNTGFDRGNADAIAIKFE
jgi:hypothetical protein